MMHPINIMHVVSSLDCGGLEKLVINLAESFNKAGFKITICCLNKFGILSHQAKASGVEVILVRKKGRFDITLPFRLARVLRQKKIDFVHTHNMGPLFYGTIAAKIARVPVIVNTRHGRAPKKQNSFIWGLNSAIIAISQDAKKEMARWNHIPLERLKVIYNGIDIEKYPNRNRGNGLKQKLATELARMVIGTVARLSPEKDQFTLLEAFSRVVNILKDARLILVGDGCLKKDLERYASERGLSSNVFFLGFKDNIEEILSTFDVFVLSSLMEGMSLTLLEAMAAGKPIVATSVGGNPEVIVDGENGFLVPPKNPERMADAIVKILQNPELAKKMGEAGRRRVEEKFSLERMVREYEALYLECLARKGVGCRGQGLGCRV